MNNVYSDFEIISADENGQITLKIEKNIPAGERGILLLEFEQMLKNDLDKGITITA